jgi:hypothetical protein
MSRHHDAPPHATPVLGVLRWRSWAKRYCEPCAMIYEPEQQQCPRCLGMTLEARFSVKVQDG